MKRTGKKPIPRWAVQALSTLSFNANLPGFFKGTIHRGASKAVCVPVLNCYSCPGALGACPIGSLQAGLGSGAAFYVVGALVLFGAAFGRLICGFLCPFGFVQDLLFRIRTRKARVPLRVDRPLRYVKYAVLVLFVLALPALVPSAYGASVPYFCQLICPAGTLGGGIPLLAAESGLRSAAGSLFAWKISVLLAVLTASVAVLRPFCKYLCPLGAFYGLFNRFSLYRMAVDEARCVRCGKCTRVCGMGVQVPDTPNSPECIRCGECRRACPHGAIYAGFRAGTACVQPAQQQSAPPSRDA